MTRINVMRGDITTIVVDAIVNAANTGLRGGTGVDGAIHAAGGPSILEECRTIVDNNGPLPTGAAAITGAGDLPARYVIHTVGPIYDHHTPTEAGRLLASCYRSSLDVASANDCRTVAFPNIGTGVYGYPKPAAAEVALGAVVEWVASRPGVVDAITFVCFDAENEALYEAAIGAL